MTANTNTQTTAEAPNSNLQIVELPLENLAMPLSHPRRNNWQHGQSSKEHPQRLVSLNR